LPLHQQEALHVFLDRILDNRDNCTTVHHAWNSIMGCRSTALSAPAQRRLPFLRSFLLSLKYTLVYHELLLLADRILNHGTVGPSPRPHGTLCVFKGPETLGASWMHWSTSNSLARHCRQMYCK
jgi:hypothetical protein